LRQVRHPGEVVGSALMNPLKHLPAAKPGQVKRRDDIFQLAQFKPGKIERGQC
jgi:hypothetical protein